MGAKPPPHFPGNKSRTSQAQTQTDKASLARGNYRETPHNPSKRESESSLLLVLITTILRQKPRQGSQSLEKNLFAIPLFQLAKSRESMTRSGKRKTSHQTGSSARRVIRRRVRYMKLSLSKMSDLQKNRCEDMRVQVLLKNTYYQLKNSITTQFPSWGQEKSAHQLTHPNGTDPLSSVGEHHLQDGDMGPEPTVANSKPPNAGDLLSNAPQALLSNLEEEEEATSIWEPQQELHCDTFFGNFQIQATTSFQDQDDLFSDIEMSEFESTPASVANGGQPGEEVQADPQLGAKPLSDQKGSGMADLEHFVELLINAE